LNDVISVFKQTGTVAGAVLALNQLPSLTVLDENDGTYALGRDYRSRPLNVNARVVDKLKINLMKKTSTGIGR